ncbi:MAG: hypothetical protein AAF891_10910, partial [Pseudomonadota bacterium]
MLVLPAGLAAQSVAELNQRALDAYLKRDLPTAQALTLQAIDAGADDPMADAPAYLQALNNLTLLRLGPNPGVALAAAQAAGAFARESGQTGTWAGLTAAANVAWAHLGMEQSGRSRTARETMLEAARGTERASAALSAGVDLAFAAEDYSDTRYLIEELIALSGTYEAQTDLETLYSRQNEMEAAGEIDAVTALIYARISIVTALKPELAKEFTHSAIWPMFYLNYQAASYGAAADALRLWTQSGSLSEDEIRFLRDQASAALDIVMRGGFSENAGRQLGFAELALAFAEEGFGADDYRVGLALRERGSVKADLGQYDAARADLQQALAVLSASPDGAPHVYLVLESLAGNAWQRGALNEARSFFERADAAKTQARPAGALPLSDFDQATLLLNRARLDLDRNDAGAARRLFDRARVLINAHLASDKAKPHDRRAVVDFRQTEARLVALERGTDAGIEAALRTAHTARQIFDGAHPAKARALVNTADQLLVLGALDEAHRLLDDALQIARASLPDDAPLRVETDIKLGLYALQQGDRAEAIAHLRAATEARKSPLYLAELPQAASNFEMLAWALLDQDQAGFAQVDAALEALQWTQVSQSAEALARMQARLASASPGDAALLKRRQDAVDQITRSRSLLSAAYATDGDAQSVLDRQARLSAELARADASLQASGLTLTGQAGVQPVALADLQAMLRPGEVVVTFLLPGLKPEFVPGLEGSSNKAIAIWADGYRVAPVREASRGALADRIDAFRCQRSLSDPGCAPGSVAALRGAMRAANPAAEFGGGLFDYGVAHALYLDLFGGLAPALQDAERLIIVPPSDMLRLPFQALLSAPQTSPEAKPRWLIRDHALSVLPSLPALAVLRGRAVRSDGPTRFLGVGDPVIGNAPDMACEGTQLAQLRASGSWGS